MAIVTTIWIEPGDTTDATLQCPVRGSGAPAKYSASDTLSGDIWQPGGTAKMADLTASWFTKPDASGTPTQTGYDQGQVNLEFSNAFAATLQPSVTYTINAYRVMASDPTRKERIATALVRVRRPS